MTQQCLCQNIPVKGNAANNSESTGGWFNLTGERSVPIMMDDGGMTGMMTGMTGGMTIGMATASGTTGGIPTSTAAGVPSKASRVGTIIALGLAQIFLISLFCSILWV
jgi:hypothetical protein